MQRGRPTLRVHPGAFLHNVDMFDSELFGFAANEADLMDPQQRLLLEVRQRLNLPTEQRSDKRIK